MPEENPFLDDQLILCSIDFLAAHPDRAEQAKNAGWDLLVVDEAHHLEWSEPEASDEYQLVESISQQAEGLLLLTATPEQLGPESHFARLRLLDPDRYTDFAGYQAEACHYADIAPIAGALHAGESLSDAQRNVLAAMPGLDAALPQAELLRALLDRQPKVDDRMVEDIGTGNVAGAGSEFSYIGTVQRLAGLPMEACSFHSNRQCGSSMETLHRIAMSIMVGSTDCGVAMGAERMGRGLGGGGGEKTRVNTMTSKVTELNEQQRQFWRALDKLAMKHREIILLRHLEDLEYAAIAEVLQIPIGTVMSRLFHARRKLRAAMQPYMEGKL